MLGIQASALTLGSRGAVFSNGAGLTATYVGFGDAAGKIAGDAGLTYIAASDLLVVNHNAAALPAIPAANDTVLQVGGLDATTTRVLIDGFGGSPSFTGRRTNGTNAVPTGIVAGSVLAQISGIGLTSALAYSAAACASVQLQGNETWDATNNSTKVIIAATPTGGSVTQAAVMTLTSALVSTASTAQLSVLANTASTTTTTGCAIFAGGVGIAGALTTGGSIQATGACVLTGTNGSYSSNGTRTTAYTTGFVGWWRSGGTIGNAGDLVFQTDLAQNSSYVFRAGATTPITIATLAPAAVAGTTPAFATVGTSTITGGVTDGTNASIQMTPTYDAASVLTVTRHNYLVMDQVLLTGGGPAACTDAAVIRFNAAIGTHKAVAANGSVACLFTAASGPTGAQTAIQGWLKWNVNGTLRYTPFW